MLARRRRILYLSMNRRKWGMIILGIIIKVLLIKLRFTQLSLIHLIIILLWLFYRDLELPWLKLISVSCWWVLLAIRRAAPVLEAAAFTRRRGVWVWIFFFTCVYRVVNVIHICLKAKFMKNLLPPISYIEVHKHRLLLRVDIIKIIQNIWD